MADAAESPLRGAGGSPARWVVVVLLAAVATLLAVDLFRAPAPAAAQSASVVRDGQIVVAPGQLTRDSFGVFLVDTRNDTIALYEYLSGERKLVLRAARTYQYDLRLDEFMTDPPPAEIKKQVEQARRLRDVPSPQTP